MTAARFDARPRDCAERPRRRSRHIGRLARGAHAQVLTLDLAAADDLGEAPRHAKAYSGRRCCSRLDVDGRSGCSAVGGWQGSLRFGETMRLLCGCGDRWRNRATPPPNTIFIILAPNDMDNVVAYILSLKD